MAPSSPPSPAIPPTMKAWMFNTRGLPTHTLSLTSLPTPRPGPGELLIRVSHVAFQGGGIVLFKLLPHFTSAPCIPELDYSGTIVAVGASTSGDDGDKEPSPTTTKADTGAAYQDFKVGDRIFGVRDLAEMRRGSGVLCEYVVARTDCIAPLPHRLSMAEAAGMGANGMTAVQACRVAGLKSGGRVLVTGASGGLGTILVQYVRGVVGKEGVVVGTCSGRNGEMVKGLGAGVVVDYNVEKDLGNWCEREYAVRDGKGFDAIFDVAGDKKLWWGCEKYLKPDGWFLLLGDMNMVDNVSYYGIISWLLQWKTERWRPVWAGGVARNHRMYQGWPILGDLKEVVRWVDEKRVKPKLERVWRMEDAREAYERLLTRRARGKVVVKVDGEGGD